MPNIQLARQRLALEIAGLSGTDLFADLVSVRFVESLTRDGVIVATLTNWGGSPPGFIYSEGTALHLGAMVKLTCGTVTLATATIASVAPHFNAVVAPTLDFTATVHRPAVGRATTLQLAFGVDLLEFNPVLQPASNLNRQPLNATGFAYGLPALRAGVQVNVNGLGAHWSGNYAVTEATHSFDLQHGYRVAFACSR
jgi:hypothetical protein